MTKASQKILLVEDDQLVANMILHVFESMDLFSDHASDIWHALELVSAQSYDLIIMDIHLGQDDGLTLAEQIKDLDPRAVFITMSGIDPQSVESRISALPTFYHFVKPFGIEEFTTVVRCAVYQ